MKTTIDRGGKQYFYPRPPRGGRPTTSFSFHILSNFYPRPPRGGRQCVVDDWPSRGQISIHALREEGDARQGPTAPRKGVFLSTPSARRATAGYFLRFAGRAISIHALREEGDGLLTKPLLLFGYFYPRPPRGGRRGGWGGKTDRPTISIHALREEGDVSEGAENQRDPISIHALREEGDISRSGNELHPTQFLSTPSARRATRSRPAASAPRENFYPRPPRGGRPPSRT